MTPSPCPIHASRRYTGATIANAFSRPPKTNNTASPAMSGRRASQPTPERLRGSASSNPGRRVVNAMLSWGHACTQSRQNVQSMLPTFNGRNRPSSQPRWTVICWRIGLPPAFDAISRAARPACRLCLDVQLQRRHRGRHEIELTDGTEILAERRPGEHEVDQQRGAEVCEHQIRRRARQRPQVEQLVGEQHEDEQPDAEPFRAQPPGPAERRRQHSSARVPDEHERAAHAEQIARCKQRDDEQAAVVDPGQERREIARRGLRAEDAVHNHDGGDTQKEKLERRPGVAPAKEAANRRPAQDVRAHTSINGTTNARGHEGQSRSIVFRLFVFVVASRLVKIRPGRP